MSLKFNKIKNLNWKIIGEDFGCYPFPNFLYSTFVEHLTVKKVIGKAPNSVVCFYANNSVTYCILPDGLAEVGRALLAKLKKEPNLGSETVQHIKEDSDKLNNFLDELLEVKLGEISDKELLSLYNNFSELYANLFVWGLFPGYLDFEEPLLSDEIENILREKELKEPLSKIFSILTTPIKNSFARENEIELLKLAIKIAQSKELNDALENDSQENAELNSLIKEHVKKYGWVNYNWSGPYLDEEYFREILRGLVKEKDLQQKLDDLLAVNKLTKEKQDQFYKELSLDKWELNLLKTARDLLYIKVYRKEIGFRANWLSDILAKEIAKRLNLTPKQVRFLMPKEVEEKFNDRGLSEEEINERLKFCVFANYLGEAEAFIGKKAKVLADNIIQEKVSDIKEISGKVAYHGGKIKGAVKLIRTTEEMNKFCAGDILVSPATTPNLMSVIKKSSAIITDEGGITSHAAIVSRELGVPCVIGTKVATKVLKDGQLVEVDADKGIVNILK